MPERRGTFGPVVLLGLASAGAAAVASTHPWQLPDDPGVVPGVVGLAGGQVPLATSLALVLLACWGVLLVTRGWLRRGTAWLGLLSAAGLVAETAWGWWSAPATVSDAFAGIGVDDVTSGPTGWYWLALGSGVLALLASAAAARLVATWPEMGSRYDAPGGAPAGDAAAPAPEEATARDLWKAMDEGRDPTRGPF